MLMIFFHEVFQSFLNISKFVHVQIADKKHAEFSINQLFNSLFSNILFNDSNQYDLCKTNSLTGSINSFSWLRIKEIFMISL